MFHFTVGLRDRKNSIWRALFLREGKGKAVIHYKSKLESQRRLKRLLAATSALGMMILFTGTPLIDRREVGTHGHNPVLELERSVGPGEGRTGEHPEGESRMWLPHK